MDRIKICICTFQRHELLRQCLESLSRMQRPENVDVQVTVIDNDAEGSACHIVESAQPFLSTLLIVSSNRSVGYHSPETAPLKKQ